VKGQPTALLANKASIFLSFIGIFIGLTLTTAHFQKLVPPCAGGGSGCALVLVSRYASVWGVPVATIGLAAYIFLAVLGAIRSAQAGADFSKMAKLGFAVSAFGLLASAGYTFIALVLIGQPCQWCLGSAAVMTLIFLSHAFMVSSPVPETAEKMDFITVGAGAVFAAIFFVTSLSSLKDMASEGLEGVDPSKVTRELLMPENKERVLGNPDAKVIVAEFADVNCGACRSFSPEVDKIKARLGDKIAIVFICYTLHQIPGHETSIDACAALEFASDEGKYQELYKALWDPAAAEQVKDPAGLLLVMKDVGLDVDKFQKMQNAKSGPDFDAFSKLTDRVATGLDLARTTFGVRSTPTFIIYADGQPAKAVTASQLEGALNSEPFKSLLN
jgi:protein-disulfide isomerase